MKKNLIMRFNLIFIIMLLTTDAAFSQTPKRSETVSVNGSTVYYEVYGKGVPLFLLHGYTQSSKSWLPFVPDYANDFEVYLIDLKGHGRSGHFTENLSIKSAAEDVDALVRYLRLDSINAIGYSYGGDILFQLELLHPGLIKSAVVIGACGSWTATDYPDWIEYLSYKNIDNLPWMREQQTSEEQITSILKQLPNYKVSVSQEDLKRINTRMLIVVGDKDDSLPFDDILNARNNLPDATMWIVPETGHGAHRDNNREDFVRISRDFLHRQPSALGSGTSKADMALLRKAVQAVNDRDFAALAVYLSDNFKRHDLTNAFPDKDAGSGAGINFVQTLIHAFPDVCFNIQDMFSENDRAVVRFQFTGTHRGDLFGIAGTGNKVDFSGVNFYRFENGKIAEVWQVWDWAGVLKQVGVLDIEKFGRK
jgi:steroid delta-isomerase-like uncharacterized protein